MINYFNFNSLKTDVNYMINNIGKDIIVNGSIDQIKAIFNRKGKASKDNDDFYLYTLSGLNCGDMVEYNNKHYLVLNNESNNTYNIHSNYIRLCNYHYIKEEVIPGETIQTGTDKFGRPIYEEIPGETIITHIYGIVDKFTPNSTTDTQYGVNPLDNKLTFTIQALGNEEMFAINDVLEVYGYTYKIVAIDKLKAGLITFTMESTNV